MDEDEDEFTLFGRVLPRAGRPTVYATTVVPFDGSHVFCVPISVRDLAELHLAWAPYRDEYEVVVDTSSLPAADRPTAVLLLAKVAASDGGENLVNGDYVLLLHPGRRRPGPDDGAHDREPRSPTPPLDVLATVVEDDPD